MEIHIFETEVFRPLYTLGLTGEFWEVYSATLLTTWLAMAILFSLILIIRFYIHQGVNRVSIASQKVVEFFINLVEESFGTFHYNYFAFIASLFLFTFFCNIVGLLPFVIEPTHNLNTTLALGVTSFLYSQIQGVKVRGFRGHFQEYLQPFFLLLPLNIVGELVKALSMSFRLFGNILGGSIILSMAIEAFGMYKEFFVIYAFTVIFISWFCKKYGVFDAFPRIKKMSTFATAFILLLPYIQLFFGLFEGLVQAFVITILSLTYLSMATHIEAEDALEGGH